ncbi:30S ribosomal protein S27ae [Candidatus Woesearchaeota archaeon]|nr:MAG: 30S ribosomal protein S27ae [Candidatus Woesearchaeota archaeon]
MGKGSSKKVVKKGKKPKKKVPGYKIFKIYDVSGGALKRKNRVCPKGHFFMANHKDRWTCGKCGYTEMK